MAKYWSQLQHHFMAGQCIFQAPKFSEINAYFIFAQIIQDEKVAFYLLASAMANFKDLSNSQKFRMALRKMLYFWEFSHLKNPFTTKSKFELRHKIDWIEIWNYSISICKSSLDLNLNELKFAILGSETLNAH